MCQLDDFYNYYLTSMASLGDPLIKDGKPDLASSNFKRIFRAAAEPAIAGGLGIERVMRPMPGNSRFNQQRRLYRRHSLYARLRH